MDHDVLDLTEPGTSRSVETPDGELHYHEAGDGPPLLLLHGSGPGVSAWANFGATLPSFAGHFRTLALDLPGFGRSYEPEAPAPMHGPTAVAAFLDALGIDRAPIVGNSLGGNIAARVAANDPSRVVRLVTMGGVGVPIFSPLPSEGISRLVDFVEDPTRGRLVEWMRTMVYDPAMLTDDFVEQRWQTANTPEALDGIRRIYSREMLGGLRDMMLDNTETFALLRRIQAPTLVTWGRDDRVTPLDGFLAPMRLIRNAELHVFPDCGHWAMLERKDDWERVVLSFLTRDRD
ncbi:MAG: alpha/beta hydrolase [Acidimicrobiales bacterium]|nr:MAG: alpha/beta hydrolase [Acidimicrobiales bacterium]